MLWSTQHCFYLATLETAQSQLAITPKLKLMKDSLDYDTSKSDHKSVARKHEASNCRHSNSSSVGAVRTSTPHPYMARLPIYLCEVREQFGLGDLFNKLKKNESWVISIKSFMSH